MPAQSYMKLQGCCCCCYCCCWCYCCWCWNYCWARPSRHWSHGSPSGGAQHSRRPAAAPAAASPRGRWQAGSAAAPLAAGAASGLWRGCKGAPARGAASGTRVCRAAPFQLRSRQSTNSKMQAVCAGLQGQRRSNQRLLQCHCDRECWGGASLKYVQNVADATK